MLTQALPAALTLAVDTEFDDTHTLTVQAAARLDGQTLAVQVYRSPAIPDPPPGFEPAAHLPPHQYGRVVLRPVRPLTPDLSPMRMVRDLLDLRDLAVLTRREGFRLREQFGGPQTPVPPNVRYARRLHRWNVPAVKVTVVGHFLTADFFRTWGREFLAGLLTDGVQVRHRKLIQFAEERQRYGEPVLEHCRWGGDFYEVRMQTRDTILPYGHASLEGLSQTFLGFGKGQTLTEEDKQDMLRTYRARTADAYGYAMADAVNTLLVYEAMQQKDRDIYRAFGFPEEAIPPLRPTLGSRVSTFLVQATRQQLGGCEALSSDRALQALMRQGGVGLFHDHPAASRYGTQTGKVHGGLLYSRSPTRFWHASPGMLRDVDMAGCYQAITSRVNVYWGRPVVYEPGGNPVSLKQAVELVTRHADPDGWLIRVSGDLGGFPNALIPSTDNAVTSDNYRRKLRHGKRRQARQQAFHLEALRDPGSVRGTGGSRLYARRIDSGVVTWATWLLVRALPPQAREPYERLTADSIVFYPRGLAASGGAAFDALVRRHRNEALPWQANLDLEGLELVQREKIDAAFVTLKFPLGEYARRIGQFRRQAQEREGKGSGADLAWKVHANSVYGVLGSAYLPTNNFVAGNVITAQARAEAFALSQALNAIQTITDGCTYRLDQIPACTYAECLRIRPDYPLRRAEDGDGIPFLDPATVPRDDAGFTAWYREHVQRFFGVGGAEYEALFGTHQLEHKKTAATKAVAFDGLGCDGAGNYLKARLDGEGRWRAEGFAARSYGRRSKDALQDWILATYPADRLTDLPPVTEETDLLSFERAGQKVRQALAGGVPEVYFPLRLGHRKVMCYRALKESAFVFETPEQRAAILHQLHQFERRTGTGLELLALRRTYGGRRQGSLTDLAEELYRLIRAGSRNLKALNPAKLAGLLLVLSEQRRAEIAARQEGAEVDLVARIDTRNIDPAALATAYLVRAEDLAA